MFISSNIKSRQCIFSVKKYKIDDNRSVRSFSGNMTTILYILTILGLRHDYLYSVYSKFRDKTYLYKNTEGREYTKGKLNSLQVRNYSSILSDIMLNPKMVKSMIKIDKSDVVSVSLSKGMKNKRHNIALSNFAYFLKTMFNMKGIPLSFGLAYSPACIEQLKRISKRINYNYSIESLEQYIELLKKFITEEDEECSDYIKNIYVRIYSYDGDMDKHRFHEHNNINPSWYLSVLFNTFLEVNIEDIRI